MTTIILQISKYLSILIVTLYTVSGVLSFRNLNEKKRNRVYHRQFRMIMFFQFLSYLQLFLLEKEIKLIYFFVIQFVFFHIIHYIYPKICDGISLFLFNHMLFLTVVGLVMQTRLSMKEWAIKQFAIFVACFLFCMFIPMIITRIKGLRKGMWIYGGCGFLLLCSVFVVGETKYGATNWISLFGVSLQPSEFVKILFVFFVAGMLATSVGVCQIIITTGVAGLFVLVLVVERDLGGALIFFIVYLLMLYVATAKKFLLFSGLFAGSAAAVIAYKLFDHVRVRVNVWRDPWPLIDDKGWQIAQSLFAIGTGSWFGMGLGQGRPMDIPVRESDFIFAAISEELGSVVGISLILICICCFIIALQIAMMNKQIFYKLIAVGFGVCYIFQVFLTVGGEIKFIPSTGVTLPFVSYGGSSVASTLIIFGILQTLCIIGKKEVSDNAKEV